MQSGIDGNGYTQTEQNDSELPSRLSVSSRVSNRRLSGVARDHYNNEADRDDGDQEYLGRDSAGIEDILQAPLTPEESINPKDLIREHARDLAAAGLGETIISPDGLCTTLYHPEDVHRHSYLYRTKIISTPGSSIPNTLCMNFNMAAIMRLEPSKRKTLLQTIVEKNKDREFMVEKCGSIASAKSLIDAFGDKLAFDCNNPRIAALREAINKYCSEKTPPITMRFNPPTARLNPRL